MTNNDNMKSNLKDLKEMLVTLIHPYRKLKKIPLNDIEEMIQAAVKSHPNAPGAEPSQPQGICSEAANAWEALEAKVAGFGLGHLVQFYRGVAEVSRK